MMLINRFVVPILQGYFHITAGHDQSMDGRTIIYISIFFLLMLLLVVIEMVLPDLMKPAVELLQNRLEGLSLSGMGKGISFYQITEQMNRRDGILLSLLIFAMFIVVIAPYIIAAFVYAHMVVREVQLIQQEREKEKKDFDRRRNLMLSDIAHDLRTPITTVYGYAKALNDGMVQQEKQEEYLEAIRNKAERMSELIQLLFDYVRLDSDGFALEKKSIDLAELLRSNAALLFTDIEESGMVLSVEIPEESCMFCGDRMQISRVFTNLLTNAVRHNGAGTEILLKMICSGEEIMILVADTGNPVPPEMEQKLFEPFAMGDESRNSKGGSGLGLSIARKIIQMHGGTLDFRTNYPGYTKAFVVRLKTDE